jgi:hypothetical protein
VSCHLIRNIALIMPLLFVVLTSMTSAWGQGKTLPKCSSLQNDSFLSAKSILNDDYFGKFFMAEKSNCAEGLAQSLHACKLISFLEREAVGSKVVKNLLQEVPANQTALKAGLALIAKRVPGLDLSKFKDAQGTIKPESIRTFLKGQSSDQTGNGGEPKLPPGYSPWPYPPGQDGPTSTLCKVGQECCFNETTTDTAEKDPDTKERRVDVVHSGVLMVGTTFPAESNSNLGTCSFVLLSRNLAITAAHCLVNQGAVGFQAGRLTGTFPKVSLEQSLRWAIWTPSPGATKQSVTKALAVCADKNLDKGCDFTLVKPKRRLFPAAGDLTKGLPDLALIEFDAASTVAFKPTAFATLDYAMPVKFKDLTTVGYGSAEDSNSVFLGSHVRPSNPPMVLRSGGFPRLRFLG